MKHTFLKISLGVIALIFSASIGAQDIIVTNDAKKIEESDKQAEVKQKNVQDQMDRLQQQTAESGEELGRAIGDLIQSENSYALDVQNTTKDPYRIKLDGHVLGVVNPYKTERFIVSVEIYGKMQAVQTSGTLFLPSLKEYKIPRQQKKTVCTVVIK